MTFKKEAVFNLILLSLVHQGAEETAILMLEKEMEKKNSLDLVNNPNAYAILTKLHQLALERKPGDLVLSSAMLKYAHLCSEKNSKREPMYAEILVQRLLEAN